MQDFAVPARSAVLRRRGAQRVEVVDTQAEQPQRTGLHGGPSRDERVNKSDCLVHQKSPNGMTRHTGAIQDSGSPNGERYSFVSMAFASSQSTNRSSLGSKSSRPRVR